MLGFHFPKEKQRRSQEYEKIKQVDPDGKSDQKGNQQQPSEVVADHRRVPPFKDGPENHGGKKRRHGINFPFNGWNQNESVKV